MATLPVRLSRRALDFWTQSRCTEAFRTRLRRLAICVLCRRLAALCGLVSKWPINLHPCVHRICRISRMKHRPWSECRKAGLSSWNDCCRICKTKVKIVYTWISTHQHRVRKTQKYYFTNSAMSCFHNTFSI